MKKEKITKCIKSIIIIFLISLVIEGLVTLYNCIIYKIFSQKNYINNEPYTISKDEIEIIHNNGQYQLKVDNVKEIIYNICLEMKDSNSDVYMNVLINGKTIFIPKENANATKFKVYFDNGIASNEFIIIFPDTQIDLENVDKIVINDNIDYLPKIQYSFKKVMVIFIVALSLYILYKLYAISNEKDIKLKKEYIFLGIAGIVGLILVFASAPQARYDEHAHYWRAYEIASGHIISSTTHELPTSVINLFRLEDGNYPNRAFTYSTLKEKLKEKLNPEIKEVFPVGATGSLTVVSYMPQVCGIMIGKLLKASPLVILWLGRLANLALYIILIFIAIKIIKNEKWKAILVIIGTFPMCMNLATTLSPDTIIISFTLLAVSYAMHLKFEVENIKIWQILILAILCMVPTVCKIVYFPLIFMFFMLPKEKFNGRLNRFFCLMIALLIVFVPYIVLNKIASLGDWALAIRTNMQEQELFTFSNIPRLILTCINTFYGETTTYFSELIGGWNTITVISIVIFILLFIVMFSNYEDSNKYQFSKKDKIIASIIIFIETGAVFAAMYLAWTQAKQLIVEGVQGRYLIPIIPLLVIVFNRDNLKLKCRSKCLKYILIMTIIYILIIGYTIKTYLSI